ncbi:MAG: DUF5777 family beta-barrel protein, partial [Syntrophothermus sp.]
MRKYLLLLLILFGSAALHAQDSLMMLLSNGDAKTVNYTQGTFKTTRIVIGHSADNPYKGDLLFLITHHFGAINTGYENLFGLKQATIRLGLEYGITNWAGAAVGINTMENTWDGFLKIKALRQSTGARRMPVTLTIFGSTAITSTKWQHPERKNYFSSRISYAFEAILARKFSERLSLQVMPTLVHYNLVPTPD